MKPPSHLRPKESHIYHKLHERVQYLDVAHTLKPISERPSSLYLNGPQAYTVLNPCIYQAERYCPWYNYYIIHQKLCNSLVINKLS